MGKKNLDNVYADLTAGRSDFPCPKKSVLVEELLIAKKDFTIRHNEYLREISTGDDLQDVPSLYHANLVTEGVL